MQKVGVSFCMFWGAFIIYAGEGAGAKGGGQFLHVLGSVHCLCWGEGWCKMGGGAVFARYYLHGGQLLHIQKIQNITNLCHKVLYKSLEIGKYSTVRARFGLPPICMATRVKST